MDFVIAALGEKDVEWRLVMMTRQVEDAKPKACAKLLQLFLTAKQQHNIP